MKLLRQGSESSLWEYRRHELSRLLIVSTPDSRALLLDPVISGSGYRQRLRAAVRGALRLAADEPELAGTVAVLQVLRGGLSFAAEEAVADALGQEPAVSFIGTERVGAMPVGLSYPRWELDEADVLVVADIIGTGGTLASVLIEAMHRASRPLRAIVLVTIGSAQGAGRVARLVTGARPDPPRVLVLGMEAYFGLPAADRKVRFPWLPFDLLRDTATAAPDFELARLSRIDSLLERCVVYDGGMRAFTPSEHVAHRRAWWQQVLDREVSPVELAEANAGLACYRQPYRDWAAALPWLDRQTGQRLHELGREALRRCEETSLSQYADSVLVDPPERVSPA